MRIPRSSSTKETAAWSLQIPTAGDYQILVHVPPAGGQTPRTRNATYIISRGRGGLIKGGVDQSLAGWQSLGTYRLQKGPVGVTLTDRTAEADGTRYVVADAIKALQAGETAAFAGQLVSSDLTRSAVAGDVVAGGCVALPPGTSKRQRR